MGRPLEEGEVKYLVTDLLNTPTDRDKQIKIGASGIGNPCDFCLANALVAHGQKSSPFWLGARVGTAIHNALEAEASKHVDAPRRRELAALKGALLEHKMVLGHVPGYGTIKSTLDVYLPEHNHLIDYKSTTKKKLQTYRVKNSVPIQYIYQQQLYGWGLSKEGRKVEKCSLVFIARDGTGDADVWVYSFDYDEEKALAAWNRMESIWKFITDNGQEAIQGLTSDPDCWYCDNILGRT